MKVIITTQCPIKCIEFVDDKEDVAFDGSISVDNLGFPVDLKASLFEDKKVVEKLYECFLLDLPGSILKSYVRPLETFLKDFEKFVQDHQKSVSDPSILNSDTTQ